MGCVKKALMPWYRLQSYSTLYRGKTFCPKSHPYQVPQLKLETVFLFNFYKRALGRTPRPSDLVLANGDTSGFSMHSDALMGWDPVFMGRMLKNCERNRGGGCTMKSNLNRDVKYGTYDMQGPRPQEETERVSSLPRGYARMA